MDDSNVINDSFVNPDGIKLFRIVYHPKMKPLKAIVFLCHGLFEHCQAAYVDLIIEPLMDIGCMVIAHDHRGHGLSEGSRGMIYSIQSLVRDVLLDIDDVMEHEKIHSDTPMFLYGHSMGGLISVYAAHERKNFFKGICLEAPALELGEVIGRGLMMLGQVMSRIVPSFPMKTIDLNDLSRSNESIERIRNDKLRIQTSIPAVTSLSLVNGITDVKSILKDFGTPFLIGHGDADNLCKVSGSQYFIEICPIKDKTLLLYPNAKHVLRLETENVNIDFCKSVVDWINSRIIS